MVLRPGLIFEGGTTLLGKGTFDLLPLAAKDRRNLMIGFFQVPGGGGNGLRMPSFCTGLGGIMFERVFLITVLVVSTCVFDIRHFSCIHFIVTFFKISAIILLQSVLLLSSAFMSKSDSQFLFRPFVIFSKNQGRSILFFRHPKISFFGSCRANDWPLWWF